MRISKKNVLLILLSTLVLTITSVLVPLFSLVANAAPGDPTWVNISTIEYNNVQYIDSKWDDTNIYAPAHLQGISDDELDTACETFIDASNLQAIAFRSTDNPGNVTGDITNSASNAGTVTVHENTKGQDFVVNGECSRNVVDKSANSANNANKWFYLSGESMFLYFPSGGPSESEVIGEYELINTNGSTKQYAYGPQSCKSVLEVASPPTNGSWTIRNSKSCNEGGGDTKGTASITIGAPESAISPGQVGAIDAGTANTTETCESTGAGMGWLICGVLDIIDNTIGFIVNSFIVDGLGIEFKQNPDPPGPPNNANQVTPQSYENTYVLWSTFRTIANVMFVIGFLVMIFGQTIGIEAYTIKKMAPRIAIAAILVQLSWVLSVEVLHWVNIIGGNIDTLLYAPFGGEPPLPPFLGDAGNAAVFVLFGGVAIGAAMGLFGALALGAMIALALLGAFATVVFRNLLVFILLILAPVAAVLWILPNTEKYAKMWWDWYIKALLVYPMIVGLIAMGKVASTISTTDGGTFGAIIGVVVYFAPYFMIPFVFKFAGGAIAAVGQMSQNFAKGQSAKVKEWEQPKVQERRAAAKRGKRFTGDNRLSKFGNAVASGLVRTPQDTAGRITGTSLGGKARSKYGGEGFAGYNEAMQKLQAMGISDDEVLNTMASKVMSVGDMEKQAKAWEDESVALAESDPSKAAALKGRAAQMRAAQQFAGNDSASVGALLLNQSYGFANDEAVAGLNNSVADPGVRAQLLNYGGALAKRGGRFDQGPNTYRLDQNGQVATESETVKEYRNITTGEQITRAEFKELTPDQLQNYEMRYVETGATVASANRASLPTKLKGHEFTGQKDSSLRASQEAYETILNETSTVYEGKTKAERDKIKADVQTRLISALGPYSNMDVKSQEVVREILEDGLDKTPTEINDMVKAVTERGARSGIDPSTNKPYGSTPDEGPQ